MNEDLCPCISYCDIYGCIGACDPNKDDEEEKKEDEEEGAVCNKEQVPC